MPSASPLDEAFEVAFQHLAECRAAWEDDPRDPACIEALGRARAALEDARAQAREERIRLGLEEPPPDRADTQPHIDVDDNRHDWQGIHPT